LLSEEQSQSSRKLPRLAEGTREQEVELKTEVEQPKSQWKAVLSDFRAVHAKARELKEIVPNRETPRKVGAPILARGSWPIQYNHIVLPDNDWTHLRLPVVEDWWLASLERTINGGIKYHNRILCGIAIKDIFNAAAASQL